MKALIDPNQIISTNKIRVCQVVEEGQEFTVAQPLYWTDCPDDCLADQWVFDTELNQFIKKVTTADQNKGQATLLLQQTDWTQIPSVSDPALSNPYLANKNAFDIYRNSVRQYALNPVAGYITWPTMPQEVWTAV
jgi:hypothetical protein